MLATARRPKASVLVEQRCHVNGSVTRERLIEAAGEIFAAQGLHGASIRDITQRAGANIASVNYHFHDKFELYALVLRRAHERIAAAMNQPLSAKTPEGRIRQLLSAMLTSAFDPARPKWHRRLLGRELLQPTPALDMMHDLMQGPSHRLWELFREIRPDLSEPKLMLTVSGVVAQCLFHVHHGHLARRMFPKVPEPTLQTLIEHVTEFSLAALKGLHAIPPPMHRRRRVGRRGPVARSSARVSKRRPARSDR
jgi:TetR/AcrR family transcriptional regulator, regulator of cefoperazone and chloramphenicol sensitivity